MYVCIYVLIKRLVVNCIIMCRYTLESFAEIAFGERPGLLDDNMKSLQWAAAYDIVQNISTARFSSPIWELKKLLQIGNEKVLSDNIKLINEYASSVIAKRKQHNNNKQLIDKPDLLSRFINYSIEHNQHLTDRELRDVVINFIVAGRDTTACMLTWATYELSQHPEWQDKLLSVINTVHTDSSSISDIDRYDACSSIPLIQAFLHETLRLHPSVPMDSKEAVNDDTLPDGTFIAAGL